MKCAATALRFPGESVVRMILALHLLGAAASFWALYDAVARLPEMRTGRESLGLRQAAVLVTDGGDNASTIEPERAREILRKAELPVYVLDRRNKRCVDSPSS